MTFQMQDIAEAGVVEISFDQAGKIWLNVDGKCAVRIGKVKSIILDPAGNPQFIWHAPFKNRRMDYSDRRFSNSCDGDAVRIDRRKGDRRIAPTRTWDDPDAHEDAHGR